MFCRMILDLEDREQTQSQSGPKTQITWNNLKRLLNTQSRPQKWIQSQQQRKTVQAFFPVCVNNDTPLLQLALSRLLHVFKAPTRSEREKTGLYTRCKAKTLTLQTALIHVASLSCAVHNPSFAWGPALSISLTLWCLLLFLFRGIKQQLKK